ncbi:hypothetical protein UA08_07089 [Talaromyces atroroseus]|uniref:Integral membrane protein n=1 Tax=Talaromyces atroroseus TaxID=1441469 RepID=A0A225AVL5_TALAT|nr:hypothetical protein UA08_07089 [Talaromyces atroroseus]OKL57527.1 hypothetical protein UA08_07089 [Talaromyces atroroseus]
MDRMERVEDTADNGVSASLQPPSQEAFPGLPQDIDYQPPATRSPRLRRRSRQPSIRLRRLSSASSIHPQDDTSASEPAAQGTPQPAEQQSAIHARNDAEDSWQANRRRSNSEPRPGRWSGPPLVVSPGMQTSSQHPMSPVTEETGRPSMDLYNVERFAALNSISPAATATAERPQDGEEGLSARGQEHEHTQEQEQPSNLASPDRASGPGMLRRASNAALSAFGRNRASTLAAPISAQRHLAADEYDSRIVDLLDVIDPEVSTLSTLTNVQNSLFVPDLGGLLNRTPTYNLTRRPSKVPESHELTKTTTEPVATVAPPLQRPQLVSSISSMIEDEPFAILPDGATLEGWSKQDIEELNDHVRHMLHSRRSKFKRAMKGFGQYISKPLGFLVTLYATLITLFGLAWVLFLIGWINVGGRQSYIINVIDNVLVALFAVMGDGLAPFRAVDTYHMIYIAHYHHLTWRLRKKRTLPDLHDENDLPSHREEDCPDVERADDKKAPMEFSILTPLQQKRLEHHQRKFSKSHTFYKPHETATHHAFPLRMLVAIVVILDCHSLLQISLGACTWGISYHVRPFALTTVILCCSITCNITGGVLIMIGDRISRKKDVIERMSIQGLTGEAMKKMEKRKKEEELRKSESLIEPYPDT